jgi:uncharacterized membrane protein
MDFILRILDVAKVPTKIVALVFLVTGCLLLFPNEWIKALEIEEFTKDYGKFIGIIFLVSVVLLALTTMEKTLVWRRGARRRAAIEKSIRSTIDDLDYSERAVLRQFYIQGKNTIELPLDNPVVEGLLEREIIYIVGHSAKISMVGRLVSVNLSPLVSRLLNPQMLGIPSRKLMKESEVRDVNKKGDGERATEREQAEPFDVSHILEDATVNDETEILITFIQQEWAQSRQAEDHRATITNWVITLTAAIVGFVVDKGLTRQTLPLTVMLIVLGAYGMLASMKLYERHLFNVARMREFRKRVDTLNPNAQLLQLLNDARKKHSDEHPRLMRLRFHTIWNWFHFLIILLGIVLTVIAIFE